VDKEENFCALWPPPKDWRSIYFQNPTSAAEHFSADRVCFAHYRIERLAIIAWRFDSNEPFDIS
jgi:hypothetical protein